MKSIYSLIFSAVLLTISTFSYGQSGCGFKSNENFIATCAKKDKQEVIITGIIKSSELAKETWFTDNYNHYQVDTNTLKQLSNITRPTEINVIIGTWCGDCHRETPRFVKIIETLNNPHIKVNYIGVDRNKRDPQGFASKYTFTRIPTLIVMQDNQEIGRIVEKPKVSLEKDLQHILQ